MIRVAAGTRTTPAIRQFHVIIVRAVTSSRIVTSFAFWQPETNDFCTHWGRPIKQRGGGPSLAFDGDDRIGGRRKAVGQTRGRRSPPDFDRTEAVRRAMHLFWRRGFKAVTARELADAMHVKPSSVYNI